MPNPFLKMSSENIARGTQIWLDTWKLGMNMYLMPLTSSSGDNDEIEIVDEEMLMSPDLVDDDLQKEREEIERESMREYFQDVFQEFYEEWETPNEEPIMYEVENLPDYIDDFDQWEFNLANSKADTELMVKIDMENDDIRIKALLRGDDRSQKYTAENPRSSDLYEWVDDKLEY